MTRLVVAGLLLAGACASTSEEVDRPAVTVGDWSGFADSPLGQRYAPVRAWTGREVLVVGGQAPAEGGRTPFLDDGAAYDAGSGRWRTIADRPGPPLGDVTGAWTGDELVVLGTPCAEPISAEEDETGTCEPGGLALDAYDPEEDRWRSLEVPAGYLERTEEAYPYVAGATGGEVVLSAGAYDWVLDPATSEGREIPAPPVRPDRTCVGGADVVAIEYDVKGYDQRALEPGEESPLLNVEVPPGATKAVRAAVFDPRGDGRWSAVAAAPRALAAVEYTRPACTGDGVVLLASGPGTNGPYSRFDPGADPMWRAVTAPPYPVEVSAPTVWAGEELLVWSSDPRGRGSVLAYAPGGDRWRRAERTAIPEDGFPAADRMILYRVGDGPTGLSVYEP